MHSLRGINWDGGFVLCESARLLVHRIRLVAQRSTFESNVETIPTSHRLSRRGLTI